MWVVAKIKNKELENFKKNISKETKKKIIFYYPKIKYHKYFKNNLKNCEKLILENYIFCFHEDFKNKSFFCKFKFVKGLEYFLNGNSENQIEIKKFVDYCKSFENKEGYLTQEFFKTIITNKAKFISGPFTNMIFEILERKKNKLKILVGNLVTTISDKSNYLYRPI